MGDVYDDYAEPTLEELKSRRAGRRKFIDQKIAEYEARQAERHYVVGLAHDGSRMAFVKKNRPEWQAGKLNGIGGKIEKEETPEDAMNREFREETGYGKPLNWRYLVKMTYPGQAVIHFYTAKVCEGLLNSLYTATDEAIEVHSIEYVSDYPHLFIRNLHWIVPLTLHEEEYVSVDVVGHFDPIKENSTL